MAVYDELLKKTSIFGLHLWVLIAFAIGVAVLILLFIICSMWFLFRRKRKSKPKNSSHKPIILNAQRIDIPEFSQYTPKTPPESKHYPISTPEQDSKLLLLEDRPSSSPGHNGKPIETVEENRTIAHSRGRSGGASSFESRETLPSTCPSEISQYGWGRCYTLRELEDATDGFSDKNVIGEGGYGVVYHGITDDRMPIAVKNLINNRGQAEREFKVEVETIGRVRHRNLVKLLGYCTEGTHRILVYEYVENGNLEQWIHGDLGSSSPLNWENRMNIILGTAKGLVYLHEGLEPKIIHRDIKSSNILVDKEWNPKVSDFGLAKIMVPERSYVTTRVMGTFGYVSPEYAQTGMLNEQSDVYSFGILVMEVISGRKPIDYSRPPGEVNLVEWLKVLVSNKNSEGVLDPKLPEKPSSMELKRILLVALRCVDPDSVNRPKMGQVINMLEIDDFPYRDEHRAGSLTRRERKKNQVQLRSTENMNRI